jgi:hypothetical protein
MKRTIVIAAVLAAAGLVAATAFAATLIVQPQVPQGWFFQTVGGAGTAGGYQNGPAAPPLGTGSLHLTVGANGDDYVALRNVNYNGVLLSSLTAMSYDTYIQAHSGCVAPYLMLSVDVNGDGIFDPSGVDDALFFEPCYQNGTYSTSPPGQIILPQNGGGPNPTTVGSWQHWEAFTSAGWWSANYGGAGGPPLTTIATYVSLHPAAKIINTDACLGGVRIRAGAGAPVWNNFDGNVDNFTIGVSGSNTTYNFENGPLPIAQCSPTPTPTPAPANAAVGGVTDLQTSGSAPASFVGDAAQPGANPSLSPADVSAAQNSSGFSTGEYTEIVGAAFAALAIGGWCARRRWLRQRRS